MGKNFETIRSENSKQFWQKISTKKLGPKHVKNNKGPFMKYLTVNDIHSLKERNFFNPKQSVKKIIKQRLES